MTQIVITGVILGLLFLGQRFIYDKFWNRGLLTDLDFDKYEMFEGEQGVLMETIINDKQLPLPVIRVKFIASRFFRFENTITSQNTDNYYRNDSFRMGRREKVVRKLPFIAEKRGVYRITSMDIIGNDLFFTKMMVGSVDVDREMYVLPKPYEFDALRLSLQLLNGDMTSKRHILDDPFTYRGVREYMPGDPMKDINWKATARTGELRVNLRDYTSVRYIRIFVNVCDQGIWKKSNEVEASFNIAAGLVRFVSSLGMEFAFYCNGVDLDTDETVKMEKSSGALHERNVYRAMARVDLDKEAPVFEDSIGEIMKKSGSNTCDCIVTPNLDENFLRFLVNYQAETGNDFIWYYPVYGGKRPEVPYSLDSRLICIPMWK